MKLLPRVFSFVLALVPACGGGTVSEVPPSQPQPQPTAQVQVQPPPQTPACPQGSTWNGSACVGTVDTSCPAGMAFVENRGCVAQVVVQSRPPPPPPPPPPPGMTCPPGTVWAGTACLVTRAEWIKRMDAALPAEICKIPLMRTCTHASVQECQGIVSALTDSCMNQRALPPFFDDVSGKREGTAVGRCIATIYHDNMKARGRMATTPECGDMNNWQ